MTTAPYLPECHCPPGAYHVAACPRFDAAHDPASGGRDVYDCVLGRFMVLGQRGDDLEIVWLIDGKEAMFATDLLGKCKLIERDFGNPPPRDYGHTADEYEWLTGKDE